ncbi:MAG TPA: ATP-binding protein [Methanocellales archaeon]|nr:ATP-binding protein [Methanocellales archaeon]
MQFTKKLDEWDYDFVKSIVDSRCPEDDRLEYKEEYPSSNRGRDKLEHEICAFANTAGGYIIFGVEEDSDKIHPKDVIGIGPRQGIDNDITNFCGRITPRVTPKISEPIKIPNSDQVVVVVYISESKEVHQASDNKYYVRINSKKEPASHYTVQKLFKKEYEFKEIINKEIEDRLHGFENRGAWLNIIVFPYGFKENLIPIFQEDSAKLNRDTIDFLRREQTLLGSYDDKSKQFSYLLYKQNPDEERPYEYMEVFHNGLIEYGRKSDIRVSEETLPIPLRNIEEILKKALEYSERVYSFSGHDGKLRIVFSLNNIKQRQLLCSSWDFTFADVYEPPRYPEENLIIQRDENISDIRNDLERIISSMRAELMRGWGVGIFD